MIKHIWSVLCHESTIDEKTNNISLRDAYEVLEFNLTTADKKYDTSQPVIGPLDFEVASLFYRDKTTGEENLTAYVRVLDPKSVELGEFESKIQFSDGLNRVRSRVKFNSMALTTSGTYVVQVRLKKQEGKEIAAAIPLDIKVIVNGKTK